MNDLKFIVISGKADVKENTITYASHTFKNSMGKEETLPSQVNLSKRFDNGKILFKVNSKSKTGRCQVLLNRANLMIGLNVSNKLYGIAKRNLVTNQFDPIISNGDPDTFNTEEDYECVINVSGSKIELYVNDVLVATAFEPVTKSQVSFFFNSDSQIVVKDIDILVNNPKVFVVMEFNDEYNDLYKEVIRPIVEKYGYKCEKADEAHTTNPILQDIIKSIKESSIIVADITPDNPNVFYEIGYAHAIDKPTILLCDRKRKLLPFDISGFRTLFYHNSIGGKTAVEESLKGYLDTLISE